MKWSQTPIQTFKEDPISASIKSHILLLRGGFIHQLASGIFTYSPFMVRSLKKLEQIIRKEMDAQGFCEIYMPMVQPKEIWSKTGRWESFSEILQKMKNRSGQEFCLGPTHEEAVTEYLKNHIKSYRDLPRQVYQIQTKYRDEFRPRFGLLRAREFLMKDGYSFDWNKESALKSYQKMEKTYNRIFSQLGVKFCSVQADSGAIGGDYSKEFHILAEQGEDTLLISEDGSQAVNKELKTEEKEIEGKFKEYKGIEVGHIFYLGVQYSKMMSAVFLNAEGKKQFIEMGCYGIGLSRTIQAVVEQSHDEHGMVWPFSISPFLVHINTLNISSSSKSFQKVQKIYNSLWAEGVDCFLDDRSAGAGIKFKDADLLGFPVRIDIGERDLQKNQVTVVLRQSGGRKKWSVDQAVSYVLKLVSSQPPGMP